MEHRLFSEISKNWAGEPLDSYQNILNFIRSTSTSAISACSASRSRLAGLGIPLRPKRTSHEYFWTILPGVVLRRNDDRSHCHSLQALKIL